MSKSLLRHKPWVWMCCVLCNNGIYFIFMSNNSLSKSRCLHHTVHDLNPKGTWLTFLLSSPMSQFNLRQMTRKIYYALAFIYALFLFTSNAFCKICYFFCLEDITFWLLQFAFVSNIILTLFWWKINIQREHVFWVNLPWYVLTLDFIR